MKLRELEEDDDDFQTFGRKCLKAVRKYQAPEKLVGSMAKRCKRVVEKRSDFTGK